MTDSTGKIKRSFKICLWGAWYGSQNVGDQAILLTIVSLLKDRIRYSKFIILSENAKYIEKYAAEAGLELHALNKWRQIHKTLYALCTSDLFIIGGGVPFYDKLSHAIVCAFFVTVAKIFGCRVMTYAVATQTLQKHLTIFIYRNILENLNLVTVRDPLTLRTFQNIGVKKKLFLQLTPDLCCRL